MKHLKTLALSLFCLGSMSILWSCGGPVASADALVTADMRTAGIVVKYNDPIDKSTVKKETYQIPGQTIANLFVSDSNPFRKDSGDDMSEGGRYVVIFIKDKGEGPREEGVTVKAGTEITGVEARVKQVKPIKTVSGKEIKPWSKAVKTKDAFFVNGGLAK